MKIASLAVAVAACVSLPSLAGQPSGSMVEAAPTSTVSDLTLDNFFTEGWDQRFVKRERADGTQDLYLFGVLNAFVEQNARANFSSFSYHNSPAFRSDTLTGVGLSVAMNQRLMLGLSASYQWIDARPGFRSLGGFSEELVAWLQLVSTEHADYAFSFGAQGPNDGIRDPRSHLYFGLSGWNDLTPLGLPKTGLYYSVDEAALAGPALRSGLRNELIYSVALAHAWELPALALVKSFSTFLTASATSALDGTAPNRTNASLTPGLHFDLAGHQELILGVQLPVTSPRGYEANYRLTYIYNF